MKEKIYVLIVTLLMCLSVIVIIPNDFKVEATSGSGNNSLGLDYDYIWNITENLSNVIYNVYEPNEIPRGRSFGSKGGYYTVNNITIPEMNAIGLEDVHTEKIEHIADEPNKNYTSIINMTDFSLNINNASDNPYPFENPMSKKEMYVISTGGAAISFGSLTHNYSFENVKIIPNNMTDYWPTGGSFNDFVLNVTDFTVENSFSPVIGGSVAYIASNETIPSEDEQYGLVFLLDDVEGCQDKLDNITRGEASIIIDTGSKGIQHANTSECLFSVFSVNVSDGTDVKELLENYSAVLVDNVTGNLTFTYNLGEGEWITDDHVYIDRIPDHYELWNNTGSTGPLLNRFVKMSPYDKANIILYLLCVNIKSYFWRIISEFRIKRTKGIILYDSYDYHYMLSKGGPWQGSPNVKEMNVLKKLVYYSNNGPCLPVFTLNYSAGSWLKNNSCNTTVDGYADQKLTVETPTSPGLEAYNVVGNITIDNNPDDAIAIISNRYDGMWGQTPGDSGVGGAILLGIAKYMKDYDIKPKYNLTFLFTTGEEYAYRGAFHYNDSHKSDNIKYWFILDQLAFDQSDAALCIHYNNKNYDEIIKAIKNQTEYTNRTGYDLLNETGNGTGSEQGVASSRDNCNSFCFIKDQDFRWDKWHRTGQNYLNGDSLKNTDQNDVNVTAELVWNVTKYFCVNHDCWLTNVTFEPLDSVNDGDTLNDMVNVNFTINTIMPNDLIMINASLIDNSSGEKVSNMVINCTVNSSGLKQIINFSIPDTDAKGEYYLYLELYNSTGRINSIINLEGNNVNDTDYSASFYLYHPFGYTNIGENYETIDDRITGSNFTVNENCYADNITAYINRAFMSPGPYKCMLYRSNDSKLIANTSEDWTPRDYEDPVPSMGWAVFNFSEPKPLLTKDTEYVITCWGEDAYSRLYYDDFSFTRGCYDNEPYGDPPDYANFMDEDKLYSIYCCYTPFGPDINSVSASPDMIGYGFNVTIHADVYDGIGVDVVKVNISKPKDIVGPLLSYDMTHISGDTYEYVFNNTWQNGQYNYSIYAVGVNGKSNTSVLFSFNVSVNASIKVCTVKDAYYQEEFVNVTDPPAYHQLIGYEFLDDDSVLHVWNSFDSYYFNTSNGMQLTNHYNKYWSHNVLMLGYYNNEEWNLIYRVDELSGFNKNIISDNETFVNVTLWKDLSYSGYDFRLAIRYYLDVDDNELTVIPYIKNLGVEIPFVLGFAWRLKDIQVDMTPVGDYIEINGASYYLNQSLNETYNNLTNPCFYIREDFMGNMSESLYLRWDENLDYKVQVKSRDGQYNAPVTLGIKIGTLSVGQEKYTFLFWHDAEERIYFFDDYDTGDPGEQWLTNPGYMVDGNLSTFASTSVTGDVEFLGGNSCNGEDLGVIGKVELRCQGYNYGLGGMGTKNIILRPVFSGGDGDDHVFVTTSSASWSVWFNITDDTNAPGKWDWKNIIGLCCDVESNLTSGFTLYCSKVEIRVTYNPYSGPEFSNPYPADGSMGVPINPLLSITVNHPLGSIMNISWYSNSSGSWQVFGVNNSVYNGTYYQEFSNASVNGVWWYWMVNASDGSVYNNSSVFMFYTGNQSKIVNTGFTNFSGYLLMQVDYLEGEEWVLDTVVVDETSTRTILVGGQLGLDTVFNGLVNTNDLNHGGGTYRVYAAFRDAYGDVLVCDDDSLLEASYEFTVDI
jgi:hypothetical protein